jgi:hypothetical protein
MYVLPLQDNHSANYKKTFVSFWVRLYLQLTRLQPGELSYEFRQYAELLENADTVTTNNSF